MINLFQENILGKNPYPLEHFNKINNQEYKDTVAYHKQLKVDKSHLIYFLSSKDKIKEALIYMEENKVKDMSLWSYQDFSMTIKQLLMATIKMSSDNKFNKKLKIARQYMYDNNQSNEVFWPYQNFNITLKEVMDLACNKLN